MTTGEVGMKMQDYEMGERDRLKEDEEYRCRRCGMEITGRVFDDNGGLCNDCAEDEG